MARSRPTAVLGLGFPDAQTFLEHYGVRGMRWGVRKKRSAAPSGPVDVVVKHKPGKRLKTEGGEGHGPHPDAIRSAASLRKARKSTVDALSTKELQDMLQRMDLEQRFDKMNVVAPSKFKIGQKFVSEVVANEGKSYLLKGKKGPVTELGERLLKEARKTKTK